MRACDASRGARIVRASFVIFFMRFFFLPSCDASRGVRARGELVCVADAAARCLPGSAAGFFLFFYFIFCQIKKNAAARCLPGGAAGSGARQYLYFCTSRCVSICTSVLVKRVNVDRGRDA